MSVIVARSLGISGGTSIPTISSSIIAGATALADSIPLAQFRTAKWLVTVTDATNDRILAYELFATITNGSTPTHTRYAVIGDTSILHVIDVVVTASTVDLSVTNNEIIDLQIDALRLQVN